MFCVLFYFFLPLCRLIKTIAYKNFAISVENCSINHSSLSFAFFVKCLNETHLDFLKYTGNTIQSSYESFIPVVVLVRECVLAILLDFTGCAKFHTFRVETTRTGRRQACSLFRRKTRQQGIVLRCLNFKVRRCLLRVFYKFYDFFCRRILKLDISIRSRCLQKICPFNILYTHVIFQVCLGNASGAQL